MCSFDEQKATRHNLPWRVGLLKEADRRARRSAVQAGPTWQSSFNEFC